MSNKMRRFIAAFTALLIVPCTGLCEEGQTVSVVNETREVTLSADTVQYPGTKASISVWLPGFGAGDFGGDNLNAISAYIGEATVSENKKIEKTFKLKEDAPSGRYTLNLYVPGLEKPETYEFDYRNVVRADAILATAKEKTAAEIKAAFDEGINDIDVEAAGWYYKYGDSERNYIAENIAKNRPTDFEDLQAKINAEINKINKTKALTAMQRDEMKKEIEENPQLYMIKDERMSAYAALTEEQTEKLYARFAQEVAGSVFPEDVSKAFDTALKAAQEKEETPEPSSPGGKNSGSGGGGGGGKKSSYSDVLMPGTETNTAPENYFTDLENVQWAANAINILASNKIVNGKADKLFCPNDLVSREEFLKMAVTGFYIKPASASTLPFSDVIYGEWYYNSVAAAYQYKIIKGITETEFGTGKNISRQDMAVILCNTLKSAGKSFGGETEKTLFADDDKISDYAKDAVYTLQTAGMLSGRDNGEFDPYMPATRAEAAQLLYRAMYRFNMF